MQDHYETLQVHPKADTEAIAAAYQRLRSLYGPERLDGAADELVELARHKRQSLDDAYAVLRDTDARSRYDEQQAQAQAQAAEAARIQQAAPRLDYRPLPPARGAERDKRAALKPVFVPPRQSGRRVGRERPAWVVPSVISGTLALVVMLTSLFLTNDVIGGATPRATPAPTTVAQPLLPLSEIIADFDKRAAAARQAAEQEGTASAWVQYANAVYDSVQVVRERDPGGEVYQQRIPLWVQASEAYSKVLELDPSDAVARSDLGVSYCYYGGDTGDQELVKRGVAQAQEALQQRPDDPRILLNSGVCQVQLEPPATGEAIGYWTRLAEANPETLEAQQAKILIERYRP